MREESKTRIAGAVGALLTSVTLGAFQSGKFGEGNFALQVCGTLIVLSWSVFLYRTSFLSSVPKIVSVPLSLAWFCVCFAPSFWQFITFLFTGHRFEGSKWYYAVWRIYAIMGLWMGFAVLNERIIRPWWKKNSDRVLGFLRSGNSISAQARKLTEDRRAAVLEGIKQRMIRVLKKKKLAERSIEEKKKEMENAQEGIEKAQKMLEKARAKIEEAEGDEKESAKEELSTMEAMVESAKRQKSGFLRDIERAKLDIEDAEPQIEALRHEYTEALHIENHTRFYR